MGKDLTRATELIALPAGLTAAKVDYLSAGIAGRVEFAGVIVSAADVCHCTGRGAVWRGSWLAVDGVDVINRCLIDHGHGIIYYRGAGFVRERRVLSK